MHPVAPPIAPAARLERGLLLAVRRCALLVRPSRICRRASPAEQEVAPQINIWSKRRCKKVVADNVAAPAAATTTSSDVGVGSVRPPWRIKKLGQV